MTPQENTGTELGRYLRARRAQVSPEQVGLTPGPGIRRTRGSGGRSSRPSPG